MIIDCFPFFNELEILTIRLHTLYDVVDKFVLVESTKTFQGNDKELVYDKNKHLFEKFNDKIIHIIDNDMPAADDTWNTYRHQLNCIQEALEGCDDYDIISVGDVDEIPRPEVVASFALNSLRRLEQKMYYYYLNLYYECDWSPGYLTPYHIIKNADMLDVRDRKIGEDNRLPNAGWHFSYMGGVDRIMKKLAAFSHVEYNTPEFNNKQFIEEKIQRHADLFVRVDEHSNELPEKILQVVPIDATYPKYIQENEQYFRNIGFIW